MAGILVLDWFIWHTFAGNRDSMAITNQFTEIEGKPMRDVIDEGIDRVARMTEVAMNANRLGSPSFSLTFYFMIFVSLTVWLNKSDCDWSEK
jgi:hypothetical protein